MNEQEQIAHKQWTLDSRNRENRDEFGELSRIKKDV